MVLIVKKKNTAEILEGLLPSSFALTNSHTIETSNGYILLTTVFFKMLDLLISSVRGKRTILLPLNESNFCSIGV